MAIISGHILDSVFGTHAVGMGISLFRTAPQGGRTRVFTVQSDAGGRFSEKVAVAETDLNVEYELVFDIGRYLAAKPLPVSVHHVMKEMAIRFGIPAPDARCHVPLSVAPSGCSLLMVVQKP
jgi:5-hydroxyisourate hydrolase